MFPQERIDHIDYQDSLYHAVPPHTRTFKHDDTEQAGDVWGETSE